MPGRQRDGGNGPAGNDNNNSNERRGRGDRRVGLPGGRRRLLDHRGVAEADADAAIADAF